jgi:hypothetical protein
MRRKLSITSVSEISDVDFADNWCFGVVLCQISISHWFISSTLLRQLMIKNKIAAEVYEHP